MRRLMNRLHHFLSHQSRGTMLALVILLVASFGYLDYQTGFEISFSFFYLIPIGIAAWYGNAQTGLAVTAVSLIVWMVSNWLAGQTYSQEIIRYFNVLIRLLVFGSIAVLLNELKLLLERERLLSRTDYLTGISNRREFYVRAELELRRAQRLQSPLSVAYLDVDNFKQVNDELGHSEGDRLLKLIANLTSTVIRKTDAFARLGGDEFVLLFPDTDQTGAERAVRKIDASVSDQLQALSLPVTLSIGVVTFRRAPVSVESLLRQADALMYQAKQQGKGRIFSAQVE